MKSGFFGKSTKTSNPKITTTTTLTKTTTSSSSLITSPPLSLSQFNLYPKSTEATTLHWSFFPFQTSPTNPIGECIFYITTFSLELFKKTTWFSSSSSLPSIPGGRSYELKEIKGKGKGLITTKELKPNTIIMYSRPFIIYDSTRLPPRNLLDSQFQYGLSQLNQLKQKSFLKLINSLTITKDLENINYLGRIETNGFPIVQFSSDSLTYSAVFPTFSSEVEDEEEEEEEEGGYSSLNHSCFPNTIPHWNESEGRLEVRTTRTVMKGEELTSTYIMTMQKRRERRYELLLKVCSLSLLRIRRQN